MRIFLTGATGYVGSAVLDALLRAGHQATALVRTREQAAGLDARGVQGVIGNLNDPASYRKVAAGFDGYVHTAFEYSDRGPETDRLTVEGLIEAASARTPGFVIYTSGIWVLGHQRSPVDEQAPLNPTAMVAWRPDHERRVLDAGRSGLRAIVIRPGIVYGGSRGIVAQFFKDATNGLMRVVGTGENHWPLVYHRDLGELYARLAANPAASGVFHATDDGDERVVDIVEAIAGAVPARPEIRMTPIDQARARMGVYADALALDQIVRSPRARALGWTPSLRSVAANVSRLFQEWREGNGSK